MMPVAVKWFLWLIIYSFIGWVYESALCSIQERQFINRGFLSGPVCPVYGVGALVAIAVLYNRIDNVFGLLVAGMVLSCTVEYITAVLLEKLFDTKWWDYSKYRFNINGRVSLLGAVVFGTLSVLLVMFVHPFVVNITDRISDTVTTILSAVIFIILSADLLITVRHILALNGRLQEIQTAINTYLVMPKTRAGEIKSLLMEKFEESEFFNERIKVLINIDRLQNIRLSKAFPKLRSLKYEDAWQKIKSTLVK